MQKRLVVTSIYVTHDQVEAMTMADRIVVLHDGAIEQVGARLEVYDHPKNLFVATLIGSPSMNLLDGQAARGQIRIGPDVTIPLHQNAPDGSVTVGFRPDALELAEPGIPNTFAATVRAFEAMGIETKIFAELENRELTAVTKERPVLEKGQQISFRPDPACAQVFGPDAQRVN